MNIKSMDKNEYRELLEDVCSEYCEPKRYCILKEFLVSSHPSPRLLLQLKCVDRLKYERSKELKHDIGWDGAIKIWLEEGYAKKFADIYDESLRFSSLYKKVINGDNGKK